MAVAWIDAALAEGYLPPSDPEQYAELAPASDVAEVNRLMRALRVFERRRAEAVEAHRAAVADLNHFLAERTGVYDTAAERIERALEGWMRAEHAASGVKTHQLPYGDLKVRPLSDSIVLDVPDGMSDAEFAEFTAYQLTLWGREDLVKVTTAIRPGEIKSNASLGDVIDKPCEFGYELRQVLIDVPDPESGELVATAIPHVYMRRRVEGPDGLAFQYKLRDADTMEEPGD